MFGCVQDELLSQWRKLPLESALHEMVDLKKIVVPQPRKKPGRPPDSKVASRRRVIQALAKKGLEGEAYCLELRRFLPTPGEWQNREGCPPDYLGAWNHPDPVKRKRFRELISKEKSRNASQRTGVSATLRK